MWSGVMWAKVVASKCVVAGSGASQGVWVGPGQGQGTWHAWTHGEEASVLRVSSLVSSRRAGRRAAAVLLGPGVSAGDEEAHPSEVAEVASGLHDRVASGGAVEGG